MGLSYNLWAGNAAGTPDVVHPMANLATGFRYVPERGNTDVNLQWTLQRSAFSGNQIHWGVQAIDQAFAGSAFATGPQFTLGVDVTPTSGLRLRMLGPNPTRSEARFAYALPRDSRVSLRVLDIAGRTVATLVDGERAAGEHEARWNGASFAPGLYVIRLSADGVETSLRTLRIE